ncbi:MAG: TonB-dependent receptor [Bryobacterales bacterium]|nr:TonB-dependent receptor [Bryobacterales bacterium]
MPMKSRLALMMLAAVVSASAQTAQTTGRVTDPSGGVVPQAHVTAENVDTGVRAETVTNEQGYYVIPSLRPGNYRMQARKDGFRPVTRSGILLKADDKDRIDFSLQIGAVSETVTVEGDLTLLRADTAEMATSISGREYNRLPLIQVGRMRSPANFVFLIPGVHGNLSLDGIENISATNQIQVNGGLKQNTEVMVDGLAAATGSFNEMSPPVDAVLEFKVQGSQMSAEYGRSGASMVNFTIKSGTNQVHGSVFEYIRNDKLDARNWLASSRALTRQNEFGASAGGPIYLPKIYNGKDRTFFFFSYSGSRKRGLDNIERVRIPTPDFYRGNFSGLLDARNAVVPIYDPQTTRAAGNSFVRDPFAGNVIPSNRLDPVAVKTGPLYPQPNLSGAGALNYQDWIGESKLDPDVVTTKIDHSFSNRQKIFGTFNWNVIPRLRNRVPLPDPVNDGFIQEIKSRILRLNHDFLFKPTLFNNLALGYNRFRNPNGTRSQDGGWPQKLGLTGVPGSMFPVFSFTNGYATAGSSAYGDGIGQTYFVRDAASWSRGSHLLKFGFEIRWDQSNDKSLSNTSGSYAFNALGTGLPGNAATGDGFASFMLGQVQSASLSYPSSSGTRRSYRGFFIQDDFKLTPTFTLNLGLRFEYERAPYEAANRYSVVDRTTPNPGAGNVPGAVLFAGNGPGRTGARTLSKNDYTAWGPRVGFAWSGLKKTVVRGGYGVYYANSQLGLASTIGFNVSASFASTNNGVTPAFLLKDGFLQDFAKEPKTDPAILNNQNGTYLEPTSGAMPRTHNFSFGVQREISQNFVVEANYVGNHNTRQSDPQFVNINQVDPTYLSLGALLTQSITSAGAAAAGFKVPYASFSGSVAQALRQFPQYRTLTAAATKAGSTDYHAFELRAKKRLSRGLSMDASYTFSKNTGYNSPSFIGRATTTDVLLQDHYNPRLEHAILPYDIPHAFLLHYAYDLPFFKNRRIGGWSISGVQRYQSGNPIPLFMTNSMPIFNRVQRPNVVSGQNLVTGASNGTLNPSVDRVINPSGFSDPGPYAFGNAAPYYQNLRNFTVLAEDFSVVKSTRITERVQTELNAQFINAFNRHRFGEVDSNFRNASFGRVKSATFPRFIQIGLRVRF